MSEELPVITSIDELPESAIEELTCGKETEVVEEKPAVKASAKPAPVEEVDEKTEVVEDKPTAETEKAPAKPKRKRRTKAEIEAEKAEKASEAED